MQIRIYSSFGTSRADKKIDPFQHFNSAIFTKVAVPGEDQVLLSAGRLRTSNSPELFPSLASQPQWQMPAQENLRHIFEAPTPPFITYGSHQAEGGYFGHQGSNFSEMVTFL